MMYKRWLTWIVFSALILNSLGAVAQAKPLSKDPGSIRGYVFLDSNRNGVFDPGEKGLPLVDITISANGYQQTYCTGGGDPSGDVPGPGSYAPIPLPSGYWTVKVHVPQGYRATTPTEQGAIVPDEGGAVTGVNFGLYGSGPIVSSVCHESLGVVQDTGATGLAIGGGLPQTGGVAQTPQGHLVALLMALVGFLALLGTPWCVTQAKHAYKRWW